MTLRHIIPASVSLFVTSAALLTSGCSKDKPLAEAEQPGSTKQAEERKAVPQAKVSESTFDLELKPVGDYAAGKEGHAEIVLKAKQPFHCNDQYPYKFKLEQSDGVKYPADVVKKDNAKVAEEEVTMKVAFTPESAGNKQIAGQFAFSVCDEDRCLIEKRELALSINVK